MRLLGPTPVVDAYLRKEFCYDQDLAGGEFYRCYIIGFCALPGRIPSFQVLTHEGAQWARVPIHMLCTDLTRCPLPPDLASWWDCYGYDFTITTLPLLNNCECMGRDGKKRPGKYLFTVDWLGEQLEEIPDQHKNHHIIELLDGNLVAYPNNKILWVDASYIKPPEGRPDWRVNTHEWSVEGPGRLKDMAAAHYEWEEAE